MRPGFIQLRVPGAPPSVWSKVALDPKGTQGAQEMICDRLLPMLRDASPCCNIYRSTSHGHWISYRLWVASTRWFQRSASEGCLCCRFWGFLSSLELHQNSLPVSWTTRPRTILSQHTPQTAIPGHLPPCRADLLPPSGPAPPQGLRTCRSLGLQGFPPMVSSLPLGISSSVIASDKTLSEYSVQLQVAFL